LIGMVKEKVIQALPAFLSARIKYNSSPAAYKPRAISFNSIARHLQLDLHRGLPAGYAEAGRPGALGGAPGLVGPVHVPLVVGNRSSALVLVVAARPAEAHRLPGVEVAAPRAAHLLHGHRRQVVGYYNWMDAHTEQYTKKDEVFHGLYMYLDC